MPIRDQHQFKQVDAQLKGTKLLSRLWPIFWFMGRSGRNAARVLRQVSREEAPKLEAQFERLRSAPDRFNEVFREHGWIASENMNFDAMEKALRLAEEQGIEAAEAFLEEHYNTNEAIDKWLRIFCLNPIIRPREQLLFLALEDHKAGRYHASVPVVLAQIDGIVQDVSNKSFYKKGKKAEHLQAKESIVGDPSGLAALAELFSKERPKTVESPISIPYRHGILHGRDLGYANRRASTKAFSALRSLQPWVEKVQSGEQFKEPPIDYFDPENATWEDVKAQWCELGKVLRDYTESREKGNNQTSA